MKAVLQDRVLNQSLSLSPAGEAQNLETISYLWKSFLEAGLDRKSTVIALAAV